MRKNIKLLAIMFAFAMQSVTIWATTTSLYPVSLSYQQGPLLGNNPKPTKAPANFSIPLSIVLDEESQQLLVTALADGEFTYYIYNESDEIVSQGALICSNNGCYSINIGFFSFGTYNIAVTCNECTYGGTFDIYEWQNDR